MAPPGQVREVRIELEIQGDDIDGYHLVKTPEGCFTADDWYASKLRALEVAQEEFGVPLDGWERGEADE